MCIFDILICRTAFSFNNTKFPVKATLISLKPSEVPRTALSIPRNNKMKYSLRPENCALTNCKKWLTICFLFNFVTYGQPQPSPRCQSSLRYPIIPAPRLTHVHHFKFILYHYTIGHFPICPIYSFVRAGVQNYFKMCRNKGRLMLAMSGLSGTFGNAGVSVNQIIRLTTASPARPATTYHSPTSSPLSYSILIPGNYIKETCCIVVKRYGSEIRWTLVNIEIYMDVMRFCPDIDLQWSPARAGVTSLGGKDVCHNVSQDPKGNLCQVAGRSRFACLSLSVQRLW